MSDRIEEIRARHLFFAQLRNDPNRAALRRAARMHGEPDGGEPDHGQPTCFDQNTTQEHDDRDTLLAEVDRQRAENDRLTRERDEALEEIRCLGLSEELAKHSGSPSREWHSVGAWLYPGETINHVIRSPREELEAKL